MFSFNRRNFWLVQRLEPDWDGKRALVCEMMGSAEFEFDAVPKSRKRLSTQDLTTVTHPITYEGVTKPVHFLGERESIEAKIAGMQEWVASGMRGKESADFEVAFTGRDWLGHPASDNYHTKVWWAIGEGVDLVWALEQEWLDAFVTQRELEAVPFGTL